MNLSNRRPTNASLRTEAWTPGDSLQLDALVGACALVAYADGWVTAEERRRLVARVQGLPAFGVFGVDEAIQAFEALIERFDKDPDDGEAVAEAAILRLRGRSGPAHLLVAAACSIAAADGGFDAEERAAILRICDLLDLEADAFDLVAAGGRR
ncbi:tellurite resistance TerB family protein [Phenylobacterium sp. 20VBR1]|uniref:Tellurite resistance TerB family protein n=1 Tax=Phenylobacterium glaciei TaxID=2803784 RepID=A0A941D4B6_9CAUL|nr:TerB family tellurite resistance protein [Phenylobacterium glaciei]MBR7620578.1 tellurite resistance TerB family protein [Phenylobacterium glaciei]